MPSPSLRTQRLSFSFSDVPLFDDVTLHLGPGWTGLVGGNGSGKTTLLRLLTGELRPGRGAVCAEPDGVRVRLCPQRVDAPDDATLQFAAAFDREALRLRARLRLSDADWATLSAGERKRWQVGAALWSAPEVLLLDEPTNHLDAEASGLLRDALAQFRGVGVLVSHDRALLDGLTQATARVHAGTVTLWPKPYSAACEGWEALAQRQRHDQLQTRRRLEGEQRKLDASRRRLEASTRARSTGARMKGPRDSDARTLGANFRAETAQQAHAASLRRTKARADDVAQTLAGLGVHDDPGQRLFLRFEPCPRPVLASLHGAVPRADGAPLLAHVDVHLPRDGRLVVQGPNGAGKSTLLRALLAASGLPPERTLLLPQELTAAESRADLEALRALPRDVRGRVLQLVDSLGVDPDALLATEEPSPGEGRKLRLGLGLGRHVWLAALDEPTNHLDLPAIERLEEALAGFPGALVLVTHDEALAARLGQDRLVLQAARAGIATRTSAPSSSATPNVTTTAAPVGRSKRNDA